MKRIPILQLSDFQVKQLLAASAQVNAAKQHFAELLHLLIGPEASRDPTLELDIGAQQLTAVRQIDEAEEE